jgi:hypothetical protein
MVPDDARAPGMRRGRPVRPGRDRSGRGARLAVGDESGDRDRTQERQAAIGARARSGLTEEAQRGRRYRHARRPLGIGLDIGRRGALGSNRHLARLEAHDDRAVAVRPQDSGARCGEPVQRCLGRVAIWVAGARRGHRHLRPGCLDEGFSRRGLAAVVRHLEQVDLRQSLGQERWVDALLDIAHQEHPARADLAQQHDGHVVDGRAAIRRFEGNLAADRPQDAQPDLIDGQAVPGPEAQAYWSAHGTEPTGPRGIAGTRSEHPRLEHAADAVALEQERQARDVVLVRMAQDDRVDPAVPRRDPPIEGHQQAIGIGSAVDEEPTALRAFHEDGIALPDVEDGDPGPSAGCRGDHRTGDEQRTDQRDGADPARRATDGR